MKLKILSRFPKTHFPRLWRGVNARNLSKIEIDIAHELSLHWVLSLETVVKNIVAHAMRLRIDRIVGDVVTRKISSNLHRTDVMRPTASIDVLIGSKVVIIVRQITKSTPFRTRHHAVEQCQWIRWLSCGFHISLSSCRLIRRDNSCWFRIVWFFLLSLFHLIALFH